MPEKAISVIIPARNEAALIGHCITAVLRAVATLHNHPNDRLPHLAATPFEIMVVDNASTDHTRLIIEQYARGYGVRPLDCSRLRAPCARNEGAKSASGDILVFVDADTMMPPQTLTRIRTLCQRYGYQAGITRLASLEGGWRAGSWWAWWNQVRRLPIARAKAMPALMFCTRQTFQRFGPFDERVAIGEEWPILVGQYLAQPDQFVYDHMITALTSSRRMELQPWGYTRTFFKYIWAILHSSGRVNYSDQIRTGQSQALNHFG